MFDDKNELHRTFTYCGQKAKQMAALERSLECEECVCCKMWEEQGKMSSDDVEDSNGLDDYDDPAVHSP